MNFELTDEQQSIHDAVTQLCTAFPESYWRERDIDGVFPHDFYKAMGEAGWLGLAIPQEFGGAGMGVQEAAVMMQAVAESGACMSGASSIHINLFGLMPVVVFGNDEQKKRMLPPMASGRVKSCFAVTEPNTGLNTTKLKTRAERRGDRYEIHGQKVWISTAQVADKVLLLARTTPAENLAPTDKSGGCRFSTPTWTEARSMSARSTRWDAPAWIQTSCSSTAWKSRSRTASARRARASSTSCTA